jgi:hypothetical protein
MRWMSVASWACGTASIVDCFTALVQGTASRLQLTSDETNAIDANKNIFFIAIVNYST